MTAHRTNPTSTQPPAPQVPSSYTCFTDATSRVGWAEAHRRLGTQAEAALQRAFAGQSRAKPDQSLGDWLRGGAGGDLSPPNRGWKARRAAASRWLPYLGVPIGTLTERVFDGIVATRHRKDGAETTTQRKDTSHLRRWVRAARQEAGLYDPLPRHAATRYSAPKPHRPVPEVRDVADLLSRVAPVVRVQIALALAGRLTTAEISNLKFTDFGPDFAEVTIEEGARRGHAGAPRRRVLPLPAWCAALAKAAWGSPFRADTWCFAGRDGGPTRQLDAPLRRLASRRLEAPITLQDIRRLGQAIARAANASRATVRGAMPPTREALAKAHFRVWDDQAHLAHLWQELTAPPVDLGLVPARAPKRCAATEPELDTARARVREMKARKVPKSCRDRGLPPEELLDLTAVRLARLEEENGRLRLLLGEQERARQTPPPYLARSTAPNVVLAGSVTPPRRAETATRTFTEADVGGVAVLGVVAGGLLTSALSQKR